MIGLEDKQYCVYYPAVLRIVMFILVLFKELLSYVLSCSGSYMEPEIKLGWGTYKAFRLFLCYISVLCLYFLKLNEPIFSTNLVLLFDCFYYYVINDFWYLAWIFWYKELKPLIKSWSYHQISKSLNLLDLMICEIWIPTYI